jgi:hypothetical protein
LQFSHQVLRVPEARQAGQDGTVAGKHKELNVVRSGTITCIDGYASRFMRLGEARVRQSADVSNSANEVLL